MGCVHGSALGRFRFLILIVMDLNDVMALPGEPWQFPRLRPQRLYHQLSIATRSYITLVQHQVSPVLLLPLVQTTFLPQLPRNTLLYSTPLHSTPLHPPTNHPFLHPTSHPTQTGLSRLALTPSDASARAWFTQTAQSLSCTLHTDRIGNLFAIRPGLDNTLPPTFAGSHLDSQPTGGRFDGVLGVCAGIEMLRLLEENWVETVGPVGVVNWTNEEGARFACSMMGSGVWSGLLGEEWALGLREVGGAGGGRGKTVREELERMGISGKGGEGIVDASWETGVKMGAHFELHIEQGPHLVGAGEKVGVVEGVQAYRWYEVEFLGRDCHTGTTSFEHRADALLAAAKTIVDVRALAEKVGDGALASVGIIEAKPGSVNTVPGYVKMSLDLRCPNEKTLEVLEEKVKHSLRSVGEPVQSGGKSVQVGMKETFRSGAVRFQKEAVDCVEAAARSVLGDTGGTKEKTLMRRMTSGAGHDSVFASKRCPTAMIFVPCKEGVSHHPEEWCEKEDCAIGASVLTEAVLRYDQTRQ